MRAGKVVIRDRWTEGITKTGSVERSRSPRSRSERSESESVEPEVVKKKRKRRRHRRRRSRSVSASLKRRRKRRRRLMDQESKLKDSLNSIPLIPGEYVEIFGLEQADYLNGLMGILVDFEGGRWVVQLDAGADDDFLDNMTRGKRILIEMQRVKVKKGNLKRLSKKEVEEKKTSQKESHYNKYLEKLERFEAARKGEKVAKKHRSTPKAKRNGRVQKISFGAKKKKTEEQKTEEEKEAEAKAKEEEEKAKQGPITDVASIPVRHLKPKRPEQASPVANAPQNAQQPAMVYRQPMMPYHQMQGYMMPMYQGGMPGGNMQMRGGYYTHQIAPPVQQQPPAVQYMDFSASASAAGTEAATSDASKNPPGNTTGDQGPTPPTTQSSAPPTSAMPPPVLQNPRAVPIRMPIPMPGMQMPPQMMPGMQMPMAAPLPGPGPGPAFPPPNLTNAPAVEKPINMPINEDSDMEMGMSSDDEGSAAIEVQNSNPANEEPSQKPPGKISFGMKGKKHAKKKNNVHLAFAVSAIEDQFATKRLNIKDEQRKFWKNHQKQRKSQKIEPLDPDSVVPDVALDYTPMHQPILLVTKPKVMPRKTIADMINSKTL